MSQTICYSRATFSKSVDHLRQLPLDSGAEVAFIGRSNAGKSSALNTITQIKGLAKVSKTPGRTQMINVFCLNDNHRLMDLPGYGYAKVPRPMQQRWEANVNLYLKNRACLKGLIIAMDIRHPLKDMDLHLIKWAHSCELACHILLTKADKLSRSAYQKTCLQIADALSDYPQTSLQIFSSLKLIGVKEAQNVLTSWLNA